jgi:hypothetical protein
MVKVCKKMRLISALAAKMVGVAGFIISRSGMELHRLGVDFVT